MDLDANLYNIIPLVIFLLGLNVTWVVNGPAPVLACNVIVYGYQTTNKQANKEEKEERVNKRIHIGGLDNITRALSLLVHPSILLLRGRIHRR